MDLVQMRAELSEAKRHRDYEKINELFDKFKLVTIDDIKNNPYGCYSEINKIFFGFKYLRGEKS